MALDEPEPMTGIHLSTPEIPPYTGPGSRPLSPAERAYLEAMGRWEQTEGGYKAIQATKPQTLGYGLNDSPAGLAAWILEKWRAWADSGGDPIAHVSRELEPHPSAGAGRRVRGVALCLDLPRPAPAAPGPAGTGPARSPGKPAGHEANPPPHPSGDPVGRCSSRSPARPSTWPLPQQAFVDGISGAILTAAIVLVLAAVAIRAPRPSPGQPAQEPRITNAPGAHRGHVRKSSDEGAVGLAVSERGIDTPV
jgi:hypothetical protein